MANRLRVVLLVDSLKTPGWVFAAVENIEKSGIAESILVVTLREDRSNQSSPSKWTCRFPAIFFSAYRALEARIVRSLGQENESQDIRAASRGAEVENARAIWNELSFRLPDTVLRRLRSLRADIVLNLSAGLPSQPPADIARFGLWSLIAFDGTGVQTVPTGFWARDTQSTSLSVLLIAHIGNSNDIRLLRKSHVRVDTHSSTKAMAILGWNAVPLISQAMTKLYMAVGTDFSLLPRVEASGIDLSQLLHIHYPNNSEMLWSVWKKVTRLAGTLFESVLYVRRWTILFKLNSHDDLQPSRFLEIKAPLTRFWADPHAVEMNGDYYVFFEDYDNKKRKGRISAVKINRSCAITAPFTILEKPYHLSYPFVFEWKGCYFMIPESAQNREVQLFKCWDFPREWRYERTLLSDVEAYDSTIFHHADMWWLFSVISNKNSHNSTGDLHIFFCKDFLADQWTPHPLNPVISDAAQARPAGGLFAKNGRIYRPSQDSSKGYGYGIKINRVVNLSENQFKEITVAYIPAERNRSIIAAHTYSTAGELTLLDAIVRRPRFSRRQKDHLMTPAQEVGMKPPQFRCSGLRNGQK